jgi:hypothetical protein
MIARGECNAVHSLVLFAAAKRLGLFSETLTNNAATLISRQLRSNSHKANRNQSGGKDNGLHRGRETPLQAFPNVTPRFRNALSAGIEIKLH